MRLKDAIKELKEGQYVVSKGPNTYRGPWSEYSIQWFKKDGQIHWTAGHTVGGLANRTTHNPFDDVSKGWRIATHWGGLLTPS